MPVATGPHDVPAGVSPGARAKVPASGGMTLAAVIVGGTLFLSAALLFWVEPMFGKLVLPALGGSPAVWTTCLLFFQSMLLAGYLYAHFGARLLGVRRHAVLHVAVLLLSILALPIGLAQVNQAAAATNPIRWLLTTLTVSLGLPFLLLASTGPLLQKWFALGTDPEREDPYFLYAASNAGSLVGLLAYPLMIEPSLRLAQQSRVWTAGYLLLIGLTTFSMALLPLAKFRSRRLDAGGPFELGSAPARGSKIGWGERLRWVALAWVPSSLLLGLTTYVSTDIAAVPLLWVVPLATYLITLVLCFSRTPLAQHASMVRWQPVFVVPLIVLMWWGSYFATPLLLPFHLAAFFLTAMACHGVLAARRPAASELTEYYLWVAVGGALGGVFNVLLAPVIFNGILEYPLVLAVSVAVLPGRLSVTRVRAMSIVGIVAVLGLIGARRLLEAFDRPASYPPPIVIVAAVLASAFAAVACYRERGQPVKLAIMLSAIVLTGAFAENHEKDLLLRQRDFFGTRGVKWDGSTRSHVLFNGTTKHGAQAVDPERRGDPLSYYTRTGPLGDVFRNILPAERRSVAVIGLGTGGMVAYGSPGEQWTFYEIDPAIERIARDQRFFTYLTDSRARVKIVLGDGRLSIAREPDASFDLMVLDAFSSDAIPVHLLTREAIALYLKKLSPRGVLVFHLSNRYLDLPPIVARLAKGEGLSARIRNDTAPRAATVKGGGDPSIWAVVGRDSSAIARFDQTPGWRVLSAKGQGQAWTDDYSNILQALRALRHGSR
jgi:hypothetical protein